MEGLRGTIELASARGAGTAGRCGAYGANRRKNGSSRLVRTKFSARAARRSVEYSRGVPPYRILVPFSSTP